MKSKTILLTIIIGITALLSVSAFAQEQEEGRDFECVVTGSIFVTDFADDINCKHTLWTGNPILVEGSFSPSTFFVDNFPCVKINELIAQGLVIPAGEGRYDLVETIQDELLDAAIDAFTAINAEKNNDGLRYITQLEINVLENIANGFDEKLEDFFFDCTSGREFNTFNNGIELDAEEYIFCKKLLADMKKELGEAAKIIWYTPDVFWKVQILEDIQENLDHILANFDEAAREAFDVECSCDKGVELEFNERIGGTILVKLIGDANSADVTVRFPSGECEGTEGNNCKLVNEFQEQDYGDCIQVYDCTNSESVFGLISNIDNAGESRAVAHGPCGKVQDRNLNNNFDELSFNTRSVGPTGGVIAGFNSNTSIITALVAIAVIIALFMLLLRKK